VDTLVRPPAENGSARQIDHRILLPYGLLPGTSLCGIALQERCPRSNTCFFSTRLHEDDHFMSIVRETGSQMRPDKAGSVGHKDSHGSPRDQRHGHCCSNTGVHYSDRKEGGVRRVTK